MEISSRDNAMVKQAKKLLSDAHARQKMGLFVLEGARLCGDAVLSDVEIEMAFLTEESEKRYPEIVASIRNNVQNTYHITEALASYLGDTQNPQGIFCICKQREATLDGANLPQNGRFLALEDMRDPGNLGTVIRTAEAFHADGLILSQGCCDIVNPKVLRGSMGGAFRLPIAYVTNMTEAVKQWNNQGFETYACVADSQAECITDTSFGNGSICLIGNEANGLQKETISACKHALTIPMKGRAESLNAAIASCIVLWELLK